MEKWNGKIAVITGASSGIGEAILKSFARNGITVIGLARASEKIEEISKENGRVFAKKCDVSSLASIKEAFKWIEEKFGVVNILVNNAGITMNIKALDEGNEEAMVKIIDTNFTGLVHVTREAVRLMKKSEDYGIVINVCSTAGHIIPFPCPLNIYPATKFAVKAYSESIRQELIMSGSEKIRVSNVSPGMVKTEIIYRAGFPQVDEYFEITPHLVSENVAEVVEFILSTPYNVNLSEMIVKPVGEKW